MHDPEPEVVHQISHAHGHDDRLICGHAPQGAPVEVIKMGMRNEDKINRRQMLNFKARLLQSLNHLELFRPDRVDQDIDLVNLNEKRGMTNPGNADLAFADFWELRSRRTTSAFNEKRRDKDARKKIALVPVRSRTQPDAGGIPHWRDAIPRRLANYVSSAPFCKTNRHSA